VESKNNFVNFDNIESKNVDKLCLITITPPDFSSLSMILKLNLTETK